MNYNIYIATQASSFSFLDLTEEGIRKIISAYKENKEYYFLNGKKIYTGELREMQIFNFEKNSLSKWRRII